MLPNSFYEDLISGGVRRRIFVYQPSGPPPEAGWPLLCMTDGNAVFATAVEAARVQASWPSGTDVEPGVIMAIGYPIDEPYDIFHRAFDLTPPPGAEYPSVEPRGTPIRTGGSFEMLRVLADDFLPWLEAQAPIEAGRRTLFGHSFGGLFTLMVLFACPQLFRTYVAVSPSLQWENAAVRHFEEAFFANLPETIEARVQLSAGEWEEQIAPHYVGRHDEGARRANLAEAKIVERANAIVDRIKAADHNGLSASFELFAGENHMSVLPVSINRAVQSAFSLSLQKA